MGIVDPIGDPRGSAVYKRQMAGVFVRRALRDAWDRAVRAAA
jgi:CO/xanthine dehydrogenase FAD-binding subunit